jgi:hypothetical protein
VKKLRTLFKKWNSYGINLPMIRVDGKPSLTATFAFISFNTALLGQIGKVTQILGPVDLSSANYLFFGCLTVYLGRRMTGDGRNIKIEDKKED